jgi:succinoglycan biosynthesis transport protein ExoP
MTMQVLEPAVTSDPGAENDVSPMRGLLTLWSVVTRHKWFVLFGVMVGVIVGGLAYLQAAPVFQSSAQVLVIKKRPDVVMPNPADQRNVYAEDYLATHTILIQSEVVLGKVAEKLDVTTLASPPAGGNALGLLRAGLTVTRDKESNSSGPTNILTISFRSAAPDDSRRLLNAVVQGYQDFLTAMYGGMNDETLQLITKARDVLHEDLAKKQEAYQKVCQENALAVKEKDGIHSRQERIHEIENQLARRGLRQKEIETRLKVIANGLKEGVSPAAILASLKDQSGAKVGDDPTRVLEGQLQDMRQRYGDLTDTLGEKHPQVLALKRRIDDVTEQLNRMKAVDQGKPAPDPLELLVQGLKSEYEENRLFVDSLQPDLAAQRSKAEQLAQFLIREEDARGDVVRARQLYETTVTRLQQINIARDAGGFDARIINPAGPGMKVAPLAITYGALALIGGLAAGLGLAYLADFNDRSFRSPVEIKQRLGLPVVGHIPHLQIATGDPADLAEASAQLVAFHRPRSPESEAFRGVRTALYFSTRGSGHQVLQVTSPGMGDGKSTLTANLAVSIAQSGKRTVLIDADFRRPSTYKFFPSVGRDVGLATVIAGDARLEDAIRPTPVPNLWLLPCGPRPANPAELLTSPRFQELLNEVRARYDIVLVDTPPVLMVSDPCAVAPRVDGVLLVIRQAKNNRPGAERAVEVLTSLGATVLGVMVNDKSSNNRDGYGYGYGYKYSYQYGYGYQPAYAETTDEVTAKAAFPALPAAPDSQNGVPTTNGRSDYAG